MVTERRPQRRLAGRSAGWFVESRGLGRHPGRQLHAAVDHARRTLSRTGPPAPSWPLATLAESYDLVVVGDSLAGWTLAIEQARRGAAVAVAVPGRVGPAPLARHCLLFDQLRHNDAGRALTAAAVDWLQRMERAGESSLRSRPEPVVTVVTRVSALAGLAGTPLPLGAAFSEGNGALRSVVTKLDIAAVAGAVVEPSVARLEASGLMWRLAAIAARAGVDVVEESPVSRARSVGDRWYLHAGQAETQSTVVVDALAGADVLRCVGIDHGLLWHADHRLVTEPVQPLLEGSLRIGDVLVTQSDEGEIVLSMRQGAGHGGQTGLDLSASAAMAAAVARVVPGFADLRVVASTRHTELGGADGFPVVGEVEAGLWRIGGSGSQAGFELGIGVMVAAVLAGEPAAVDVAEWSPKRSAAAGFTTRSSYAEVRG